MTNITENKIPSEDDIKAMNVHQRMHALMKSIRYAPKNGVAPQALGAFPFIKHDDLIPLIRPLVLDFRLTIEERVRHYNYREGHILKDKYGNDKYSGGLTEIIMDYEIINIDNPDQRMLYSYVGQGVDSQDKGAGKATTYAKKNFYLGSAQLERGEGEDVEAHDNNFVSKKIPKENKSHDTISELHIKEIRELIERTATNEEIFVNAAISNLKVKPLGDKKLENMPDSSFEGMKKLLEGKMKSMEETKTSASVH